MSSFIIKLVLFMLVGYGLYGLAKKMHIKNAWMSWVPFLQLYVMTQVAGVSFRKYILYPILVTTGVGIVLYSLLHFLLLDVFLSYFRWVPWSWNVSLVIVLVVWWAFIGCLILCLIRYIIVLHLISKKTWGWILTTLLLFFFPFIMFPVAAYTFKGLPEKNAKEASKEGSPKEES